MKYFLLLNFRLLVLLGCAAGLRLRGEYVELPDVPAPASISSPAPIQSDSETRAGDPPAAVVSSGVPPTSGSGDKAETNSGSYTPEPGSLPTSPYIARETNNEAQVLREFQLQLELAKKLRAEKSMALATSTLVTLLETNAPNELKRKALFELALVNQDDNQLLKAQQIFSQYLKRFPDDASAPEILLRQGLLYRQMGVPTLAISKFYAVMSTALKLNLSNMDYYKKLVLQAQSEIADTYYQQGDYAHAADFFTRLLKADAAGLNKPHIQVRLIRSLACMSDDSETATKSQIFLEQNADSTDVPEIRFLLASALKHLGRNQDSMRQVLLLLQSQIDNARKEPETWIYWQQRAGNEIANQLYKEGDYINALEIYLHLAGLNKTPAWQIPIWYQTGLVYEQLQQWEKATEVYQRILDRRKEVTDADSTPSLLSLFDMAKWRNDYIAWMQKSKATNLTFQRTEGGPKPPPGSP